MKKVWHTTHYEHRNLCKIQHREGGAIYIFEDGEAWEFTPRNPDHVPAILEIPIARVYAIGHGRDSKTGAKVPIAFLIAENPKEVFTGNVSRLSSLPMEPVEAISLEIEDLILSECDNPRYSKLKNPTMRDFYTAYVIHRRTLEGTAKNAGCSVRTVKDRKRTLEQDLSFFQKIETPLQDFQKSPELREARTKRDSHRKNQKASIPKQTRRGSTKELSAWEEQTTLSNPPKNRKHI